MAKADAIRKKADGVLKKFAPTERSVYKRIVTKTGGDELIGRPSEVEVADTLMSPQPVAIRINSGQSKPEAVRVGGSRRMAESYRLVISSTAITTVELNNPDLLIVFKDSLDNEEVYTVTDFEPSGIQGSDIVHTVLVRSVNR